MTSDSVQPLDLSITAANKSLDICLCGNQIDGTRDCQPLDLSYPKDFVSERELPLASWTTSLSTIQSSSQSPGGSSNGDVDSIHMVTPCLSTEPTTRRARMRRKRKSQLAALVGSWCGPDSPRISTQVHQHQFALISGTADLAEHPSEGHKCRICGRVYKQARGYRAHIVTHLTATEFPCDMCDHVSSSRDRYLSHLKTHGRTDMHPCQHCHKYFRDISTLQNHERIHTGDRPFVCGVCGKSFKQCSTLTRHQKTHY